MDVLFLVIGLLILTVACVVVGKRLRLPYPILRLLTAMLLTFGFDAGTLQLDPELVLPLFLPPWLFATAQQTSWGVFRARWRVLVVLAVVLTATTALAVASLAWLLVPGLAFPVALALGAMVAPPDPVAIDAVSQHARISRRIFTTLQTEGLFNDAVAIVLFQAALGAVVTHEESGPRCSPSSFWALPRPGCWVSFSGGSTGWPTGS